MKRQISIILAGISLLAILCSHIVLANEVQPRWSNINDIWISLNFSGTTGEVEVNIDGQSGVDNITADVTLYYMSERGWRELPQNWSYDEDEQSLTINETFAGTSGRTYKITVDATVTKDGFAESVSDSSSEVTCP